MTIAAPPMTAHEFDDRNIQWRELAGFKHMMVSIFFVDEEKNLVDLLIKFDPNEKVLLHRHLADTNTFVIEGDHVIYEPDGQVREVRPVGRYTFGTGRDAHDEGGGPNGCVLYYSVRGETDALFDMLDANLNVVATLHTADFKAALDAQQQA
ncbi:MAG: regulator [Deltaproteobacteria bacterium]|nr:regulator [Deltaproteobacteria bacterium]